MQALLDVILRSLGANVRSDDFPPTVVRVVRTVVVVAGVAALGGALDGLNAVDWSQLQEDANAPVAGAVPIVVFVMGALGAALESAIDQLKKLQKPGDVGYKTGPTNK